MYNPANMPECPGGRKYTQPHHDHIVDQGLDPKVAPDPFAQICEANAIASTAEGYVNWAFCQICAHRLGKNLNQP